MDDDVRIVAEVYPGLRNVRRIFIHEVRQYLQGTKRPMGTRWHMMSWQNYRQFFLEPGQGMLCFMSNHNGKFWTRGLPLPKGTMTHAFCIWRGLDNRFCVYDPAGFGSCIDVPKAVYRMGGDKIFSRRTRSQGYAIGSCLTYCFIFMDYSSQHLNLDAEEMLDNFYVYLGKQSDERVFHLTEELFQKEGVKMVLRGNWQPDHLVQKGEKPVEKWKDERKDVHVQLPGLTKQQVDILRQSVTVVVKEPGPAGLQ